MANIRKFQKLFLYAGVEKEEYYKLLPQIREENLVLLKVFSALGSVMFFILLVASMLTNDFAAQNSMTYLACGIEMLILLICSLYVLPRHPACVTLFVYLFEITLYVFGIHISMLHTEKPAVSAIAFLLVSPLLFCDRPVRLTVMITAVVALFCGIVVRRKSPDVIQSDVWNMITFGILAIATTVFIMSIKIRALSQSRQIAYMSQTDLLTGAKNRNYYENQLQKYPGLCSSNLICVYTDVNGLHEMNNKYGHQAGDKMLQEIAAAIQQHFGLEHTYRIGGDEFVAFRIDGQPEKLFPEIDRLKQDLTRKNYHISVGIAIGEKAKGELNMYEIVSEAEANMFADKRAFYLQAKNDRRSR